MPFLSPYPAIPRGSCTFWGARLRTRARWKAGSVDVGNARFGGQECLVVFEDVFVPWERVFMFREPAFAGMLVERFAGYHRQSYGGCKVGVGDVLIGAVANLLDYNGIGNASHARDKLVEMIHLNETLYACGLACSTEGRATPSGTYLIDLLLANVCKLNVTRFPYEIARIAEDLAGGLMVTPAIGGRSSQSHDRSLHGKVPPGRLRHGHRVPAEDAASGGEYHHWRGSGRLQDGIHARSRSSAGHEGL